MHKSLTTILIPEWDIRDLFSCTEKWDAENGHLNTMSDWVEVLNSLTANIFCISMFTVGREGIVLSLWAGSRGKHSVKSCVKT